MLSNWQKKARKNEKVLLSSILLSIIFALMHGNVAMASSENQCMHENLSFIKNVHIGYESNGSGGHTEIREIHYRCVDCKEEIVVDERNNEACTYNEMPYDDLGHSGKNHRFRLKCKCGYTIEVFIPCMSDDGSHVRPF